MDDHPIPGIPLGGIVDGVLVHLFDPDVPVQLVASDDIGAFAALAFADPQTYRGCAIELAGDELTSLEAVALIGRAIGREVTYRQVTAAGPLGLDDAAVLRLASERVWHADIPELRRIRPELLTFSEWLRLGGAAGIEALFTGATTGS